MNRGDRDSSRASLYDRLRPRQSTLEQMARQQATPAPERRYDPDRLRVIDGVALTSAGLVGWGNMPDKQAAVVDTSLAASESLLVHRIDCQFGTLGEPLALQGDRARRLYELARALVGEAMTLLERLPTEAGFEVVLSMPVEGHTTVLRDMLDVSLRGSLAYPRMTGLRLVPDHQDLHDTLATPATGGAGHVLWLSIDCVLHAHGIGQLRARQQLATTRNPQGIKPSEAAVALMIQRIAEDGYGGGDGYLLKRGVMLEHNRRTDLTRRQRYQSLAEILARVWPDEGATAGNAPGVVVADSLDLPGRRADLAGALLTLWPELDLGEECRCIDYHFGWPGTALIALQLVVALVGDRSRSGAVLLQLSDDHSSRALALLPASLDSAAQTRLESHYTTT
ncbi:hypothetical protein [Halomonas sp. DN3]|uniref:hypothetical protein n=1 Tax=Halomonas sp. DN3 TaxID=2953657 RepID=UPI0020A1634A|nr:hypothetical protein [Halomonas sp. DN3]USZ50661.1 hypothetical protein NKF27_03925 [Halomonas sp. DN3]